MDPLETPLISNVNVSLFSDTLKFVSDLATQVAIRPILLAARVVILTKILEKSIV